MYASLSTITPKARLATSCSSSSARRPHVSTFWSARCHMVPRAPHSPLSPRSIVVHSEASKTVNAPELTEEVLFEKARFMLQNTGYYGPFTQEGKDILDEDFVFRGPVIGPLTKKSYIDQLTMFSVYKAFPDIAANAWGFSIDPMDPLRVWFMVRETGTMTQPWKLFGESGPELPATGNSIEVGPEVNSVIFTPEGKAKYLSIGYIADRIVSAAPNGSPLVAVPALLRAAGISSTGALLGNTPLARAVRSATNAIGSATGNKAMTRSFHLYEELPQWFRDLPNSKLQYGDGL